MKHMKDMDIKFITIMGTKQTVKLNEQHSRLPQEQTIKERLSIVKCVKIERQKQTVTDQTKKNCKQTVLVKNETEIFSYIIYIAIEELYSINKKKTSTKRIYIFSFTNLLIGL